MKTSAIIRNKHLPSFIKNHPIFSKFDEIKKIFPLIGLPNCSMPVSRLNLVNDDTLKKDVKSFLKDSLQDLPYIHAAFRKQLIAAIKLVDKCKSSEFQQNNQFKTPIIFKTIGISDLNKFAIMCDLRFNDSLSYKAIETRAGVISKEKVNHIFMTPYKEFGNLNVVFSSDNMVGAWDIATMAERGIDSCQSWNGSFRTNLIGSIVDPFAGIIYLTDNNLCAGGQKMLSRAIVRYVVHKNTHKPALLLERRYFNDEGIDDWYDELDASGFDEYSDFEIMSIKIFTALLQKKLNNKLPIIQSKGDFVIPNSSIVQQLSKCKYDDYGKDYCRSYRDSKIAYSKSKAVHHKKIAAF